MSTPDTTAFVLDTFRKAGALLEGHFILTSGRHSRQFLQKAFVFMDPQATSALCAALAQKIIERWGQVDLVVSPAVGAVIPGYETARHLGCKAIYVEREGGVFKLRRGFEIPEGARVVVVEDIVSTGISVRETLDAIKDMKGTLLGAAVIVDRTGGTADVGTELLSLAQVQIESFDPAALPDDLKNTPAIKPGSRALSAVAS
jgi:orotate phosphoribosyltransferase